MGALGKFTWEAIYDHAVVFPQFNETGEERSYEHLERDRVTDFRLYDTATGDTVFMLHLEPGQRLIYRRRISMSSGVGMTGACHLVGWRRNINGETIQSIAYVFENGQIEMAGRFDEKHPWFYSPKLRPFEV